MTVVKAQQQDVKSVWLCMKRLHAYNKEQPFNEMVV
jgi:hypothetical protein